LAERLGVVVDGVTDIKDSNNTIVGLNSKVVAKVATFTLAGRELALDRECAVLRHRHARPDPRSRNSAFCSRTLYMS
jgi:hypothetical protein